MTDAPSPRFASIRPQFVADACLRTLGTLGNCRLCQTECPAAAIDLAERAVAINDSCIGCGRCVATCPTGALHASQSDNAALTARASRVEILHVECERVPPRLHAPNTVVLPCTGALGTNELLALAAFAEKTPPVIVDRGWCGSCPAGGDEAPPGAAARAKLQAMFAEIGLPERAPSLVKRSHARAKRDDNAPGHRSRRAFLRRIVTAGSGTEPSSLRDKGRRRRELIALLRRIGGSRLPPSALPDVRIDDRCANNRLCASVCPTAALANYAGEDIGVEFDAERCIACGACVSICPEHALALAPAGAVPVPERPVRLTAHRLRACSRCDTEFSARDGTQELCPNCRKDVGLFR